MTLVEVEQVLAALSRDGQTPGQIAAKLTLPPVVVGDALEELRRRGQAKCLGEQSGFWLDYWTTVERPV